MTTPTEPRAVLQCDRDAAFAKSIRDRFGVKGGFISGEEARRIANVIERLTTEARHREQAACEGVEGDYTGMSISEIIDFIGERFPLAAIIIGDEIDRLATLPKPEQPPVEQIAENANCSTEASEQGEVTQEDRAADALTRWASCLKIQGIVEVTTTHDRVLKDDLLTGATAIRTLEAEAARLRKSRDDWERVAREAQADYETEMARATAAEAKLAEARDVVRKVIAAWESLPCDRHYGPKVIDSWLSNQMATALNEARKTLSDKEPA